MKVITSISNLKIKEIVKLREGRHRRRSGKFLIDGIRELQRAKQAGVRILDVFTVHPVCADAHVVVHQVTESVMQRIAFGDRNEGLIAVAEEPVRSFDRFKAAIRKTSCPLLAVVEGIEKPGNLGAIFRSADAAGLDGVMIAGPLVDPFHSNAIRSSMGTVFSMPMASEPSTVILHWLRREKIQIAAAWCTGTVPYTEVDFSRPTAIVLGSEADGLTGLWSDEGIIPISLPMRGIADSLNVSVAAGILFYEANRQREL